MATRTPVDPHAQTHVRVDSNLGEFDLSLLDATAPKTVANFLGYARRGDYTNSIIHRRAASLRCPEPVGRRLPATPAAQSRSPHRQPRSLPLRACVLPPGSREFSYDFSLGRHGFVADFADLPANYEPKLYALRNGHGKRPAELDGRPALFLSGSSRSDDLWMFWRKKLTGRVPESLYKASFDL